MRDPGTRLQNSRKYSGMRIAPNKRLLALFRLVLFRIDPKRTRPGGGAVVSWLVRQAVWVRALARGVVFLGKALYSHRASLHPSL